MMDLIEKIGKKQIAVIKYLKKSQSYKQDNRMINS